MTVGTSVPGYCGAVTYLEDTWLRLLLAWQKALPRRSCRRFQRAGPCLAREDALPNFAFDTQSMHDPCMATKTISIEIDAYELLVRERKDSSPSGVQLGLRPSCRTLSFSVVGSTRRQTLAAKRCENYGEIARPAGFEPTTFGFGGRHSIQLSYGRLIRGRDSTRRCRAASSSAAQSRSVKAVSFRADDRQPQRCGRPGLPQTRRNNSRDSVP
jgi:hypothetical protein